MDFKKPVLFMRTKKVSKAPVILELVILFQLGIAWYIYYVTHFVKLAGQSIFITDLIGNSVIPPIWSFYLAEIISTLFIWLISQKYFKGYWTVLPAVIFGLSLWPAYLVAAQGNGIITLSLLLGLAYAFIRWQEHKWPVWPMALFLISLYLFSFLIAPAIWIIIGLLSMTGIINKKERLQLILVAVLMYLPVFFGAIYNREGLINILSQQMALFSDPGLLNGVNTFKGESQQAGHNFLSKISENKYLYIPEYLLLKTLKHFSLSTYFSDQEKLLGFSISPPLYFGLMIPFLYGIYAAFKRNLPLKNLLLITIPLAIPSIIAPAQVNLPRLILVMPAIVFFISFGFRSLYLKREHILTKLVLSTVIIIVLAQFAVSIIDISLREYSRFQRYFGTIHKEVAKQ